MQLSAKRLAWRRVFFLERFCFRAKDWRVVGVEAGSPSAGLRTK